MLPFVDRHSAARSDCPQCAGTRGGRFRLRGWHPCPCCYAASDTIARSSAKSAERVCAFDHAGSVVSGTTCSHGRLRAGVMGPIGIRSQGRLRALLVPGAGSRCGVSWVIAVPFFCARSTAQTPGSSFSVLHSRPGWAICSRSRSSQRVSVCWMWPRRCRPGAEVGLVAFGQDRCERCVCGGYCSVARALTRLGADRRSRQDVAPVGETPPRPEPDSEPHGVSWRTERPPCAGGRSVIAPWRGLLVACGSGPAARK